MGFSISPSMHRVFIACSCLRGSFGGGNVVVAGFGFTTHLTNATMNERVPANDSEKINLLAHLYSCEYLCHGLCGAVIWRSLGRQQQLSELISFESVILCSPILTH